MVESRKTKGTVLVICVDRDDDLGRKTGIKGPLVGRKANIDAVLKFGISDPSDSDVNALFKAIQVYDNLVKRKENVEIITLTGDIKVGLTSDRKIRKQLDTVLKNMDLIVDEAVLVSDGDEDTHIMPILKEKIRQIYIEKIVVKQSSELEGIYYMFRDFLDYVISDSRASKIFLGLPSVALILYAVFGAAGGRLILGIIGLYLLIKGFHLDPFVQETVTEIRESIQQNKFSFFLYIVACVFVILGIFNGYAVGFADKSDSMLISTIGFVQNSILMFSFGAISMGVGKALKQDSKITPKLLTYIILCLIATGVIFKVTEFILNPEKGYRDIIYTIVVGGLLLLISNVLELIADRKK